MRFTEIVSENRRPAGRSCGRHKRAEGVDHTCLCSLSNRHEGLHWCREGCGRYFAGGIPGLPSDSCSGDRHGTCSCATWHYCPGGDACEGECKVNAPEPTDYAKGDTLDK